MDLQFFKDWAGLVVSMIAILTAIYSWMTSQSKTTATEMEELKEQMGGVDKRLTSIETQVNHLPDEKAMTALKLALSEMNGKFGRMEESISGITRTVYRVEEYLLKKGSD
ncbi:DUF2730 family protein [Oryzifoliimicrobium ureilyticus]|uniref:DUF2730 family protein n=1 Tax=Oryzifoliimicrobium ureilyticus TaxID=3113724 RepID=UPI003076450C